MSCGPRTAEKKIICGARVAPKGGYWQGEAPSLVRHILVSWRWRPLVPTRFSPHLAPCDTDGPAGSTRWPFFFIGLQRLSGMVNYVGAGNCRTIARHPLVGRCCLARRPLFLFRDGKEEMGGEVPRDCSA